MGGRSDRRGPQERVRHPQGRSAAKEPGAVRLAGAAGGPRRERRPFPRTGGHKQRRRAAATAATSGAAAPDKNRHPERSRRISGVEPGFERRAADVVRAETGRAARLRAGVPRGRDQAPHPVRRQPAVCVISPAPFQAGPLPARASDRHRKAETPRGLGRSAQRAIERGRAPREAPNLPYSDRLSPSRPQSRSHDVQSSNSNSRRFLT